MHKPNPDPSPSKFEAGVSKWLAGAAEWERQRKALYEPSAEKKAELAKAWDHEMFLRHTGRHGRP